MIEGLLTDTNPLIPSLEIAAPNHTWVSIGQVRLFFSYDACVGATLPGIGAFANADFVGWSRTTTRHMNAQGFANRPAIPGDRFARLIALALGMHGAASPVQHGRILAQAWLEARDEANAPAPSGYTVHGPGA